MTEIEINTLFSNNGIPATDIGVFTPGYPTIRIWEVDGNVSTLIVGGPNGTGLPVDGVMNEITNNGSPLVKDGFYTFLFTDIIGYDPSKKYLIRTDGGTSLSNTDRYQTASIDPIEDNIINGVWDEQISDHQLTGSSGSLLSQIKADTTQLFLDINTVNTLVNTILKYDTNRTKVDPVAKTLTVYDDDCTTILRVFQLLDDTGTPSTDSVCERNPISASDGKPTC